MDSKDTMTVLIQRIETISKVVYRPYMVRRKKFLWWTTEKRFPILKRDNGREFVDPRVAVLYHGGRNFWFPVDCDSEEEAIATAKEYIAFVQKLTAAKEFGTKITTQSEFLFIDEKTGDILFQKIEPVK